MWRVSQMDAERLWENSVNDVQSCPRREGSASRETETRRLAKLLEPRDSVSFSQ